MAWVPRPSPPARRLLVPLRDGGALREKGRVHDDSIDASHYRLVHRSTVAETDGRVESVLVLGFAMHRVLELAANRVFHSLF